jgi:hypothetical protein
LCFFCVFFVFFCNPHLLLYSTITWKNLYVTPKNTVSWSPETEQQKRREIQNDSLESDSKIKALFLERCERRKYCKILRPKTKPILVTHTHSRYYSHRTSRQRDENTSFFLLAASTLSPIGKNARCESGYPPENILWQLTVDLHSALNVGYNLTARTTTMTTQVRCATGKPIRAIVHRISHKHTHLRIYYQVCEKFVHSTYKLQSPLRMYFISPLLFIWDGAVLLATWLQSGLMV